MRVLIKSAPHTQTGSVIEKVAAKFKGCLLAEWMKMFVKEWDAQTVCEYEPSK